MSYRVLDPTTGELRYRQAVPKSIRALPVDRPLEQASKILSSDEPRWIELDSENIKRISYDADREVLSVQFRSNPDVTYQYYEVSETLVNGLRKAESATEYLRRYITNHKVRRFTSKEK